MATRNELQNEGAEFRHLIWCAWLEMGISVWQASTRILNC